MDAKQPQQYRQHFNLSEATKRMLEELTAQRYPGKQRRQSQLIEDLITEAFTKKEHTMSAVTAEMQDPEPGKLAPSTIEAVNMAQQEALYTGASEIGPEHLFLGLIEQGNERVVKVLRSLGMDVKALRAQAAKVFGAPNDVEGKVPEGQSSKKPEDIENFNEVAALSESSPSSTNIKSGDVVEGVIVHIDQNEILVDIGLESEGVLPTKELPASGYGSFNELHINDRVLVYVIESGTPDGRALLSLKRANVERQWAIAEEQYRNGELLKARVIDYNLGGLFVDVAGIRGFVPISQILSLTPEEVAAPDEDQEIAAKLAAMKDKILQLKIIEINRARNRLILSERLAMQEWRQRRRDELLNELRPGQVRRGVVSQIANFGAFVDLGGADGLVHISQLAWSRVNHPSEVLHVGQEVEVRVLSVDKEKKKIALSIKRAEVDPWTTVGQGYTAGQVVTGTITKIAPFGVFASIEDGVEGLIHLSEITPGTNLKTDLHEGQQVQLCILSIDIERRRLSLSMRQAEQIFVQGIPEGELPELLEGNVPEPFTIVNVYLPLSRDAKGCIQWAKSFATHSMQSALVLPEHLLLSILRCQRMRQFLTQLLPATEPLLAGLTGEMGYTNYIDQLIRTRVRQTIRQEAIGKSTSTVRPLAQANLCPSCKRPVKAHWKHCVYCGTSLAMFCPNCGAPYAEVEDVRFCYECGSRLEQAVSSSPKLRVKKGPTSSWNFSKGEAVRILDGPFTGFIGTVTDVDTGQNKVTVLITFFGTGKQVVLDFPQVERR